MKLRIYLSILSLFLFVTTVECKPAKKQVTKKKTAAQKTKLTNFSFQQTFNTFCTYIKPSKPEYETFQKKYSLAKNGTFSLQNNVGTITIEPAWNTNSVSVTATKSASSKENLRKLTIVEKITSDRIALAVNDQTQSDKRARIDFKIIVPGGTVLDIDNKQGNIIGYQVDKHFSASTQHGNIEVVGASGPVIVSTGKRGNISVSNSHGTINAKTHIGTITIKESCNSILASTHKGRINVYSCEVPSTSKIYLTSNNGDITLRLPTNVNADIQGRTNKGIVTCAYPITQQITTQLNSDAWKRFTKEVNGSIGSGEAQIFLTSIRSNISILKIETA